MLPSYNDARARFCVGRRIARGNAMFFGLVLDAGSSAPLPGASVSLVYVDSSAEPPASRVRRARAADDGVFAICGLPERYTGTVQASRNAARTAEAPVASRDQPFLASVLTLNIAGDTTAVLTGRVTERNGTPIAGAQVALEGTTALAVTAADGAFSLEKLPSGTQAVVVRKIGFAPATLGVNLTTRAPRQLAVTLLPAQTLAPVRILGKLDDGLSKVGFTDRMRGSRGRFIGPDEVERRQPQQFTDLLQAVAGFQVTNTGGGRFVQSTRTASVTESGCVNFFVDGTRFEQMQPGDLDDAFRVADIGALEIYSSPNDVPAEFHVVGKACPTIAMWTKTRLAR